MTLPSEILEREMPAPGAGGGGPSGVSGPRDGDGGEGGGPSGIFGDPTRFGVLAFLATVSMLFLGFTSAYVLRRAAADWVPIEPPRLIWVNTALLMLSSLSLEVARRRWRSWDVSGAQRYLFATGALGGLFLVGQVGAWRELSAQGVFLATSPHSSFVYVLTGAHGAHLLGGLVWFAVLWSRLRRLILVPATDGIGLFAVYWHYLGGLWVYLAVLLFAT